MVRLWRPFASPVAASHDQRFAKRPDRCGLPFVFLLLGMGMESQLCLPFPGSQGQTEQRTLFLDALHRSVPVG